MEEILLSDDQSLVSMEDSIETAQCPDSCDNFPLTNSDPDISLETCNDQHDLGEPCYEPEFTFEPIPDFLNRLRTESVKGQSVQDLKDLYFEELSYPVGCRLSLFWPRWAALGSSSYVIHKLKFRH